MTRRNLEGAACRNHPTPEIWFPTAAHHSSAAAKAVCRSCPVREPCLLDALERNLQDGVFGGLSTYERNQLRHQPPKGTR